MDIAANGDTVLVSPGTYRERINFHGKAITVRSAAGPDTTIIDGDAGGPVVTFNTREDSKSVIQGFTIQSGSSQENGGGVYVYFSSPAILSNVIVNNRGCGGAGIGAWSGGPLIQGNTIAFNTTEFCNYGQSREGGGIKLLSASAGARILDNVITRNTASDGGGISLWQSGSVLVRNNVITENTATTGTGGGIAVVNYSQASLVQNLIAGNKARGAGGVSSMQPLGSVVNNTIAGNISTGAGSTAVSGIETTFSGETRFVGNLIIAQPKQPALRCFTYGGGGIQGLFRGNDVYTPEGAAYQDCVDFTGNDGNLSVDPQFVNPGSGNYRLRAGSPAIGKADATAPELSSTDLDGNPRTTAGKVDIGAYQYVGSTSASFSPASLTFAAQSPGAAGPVQIVTVSNTGSAPLQIGSIVVEGDFSQTNSCAAGGVAPGRTCVISVTFAPTARGQRTGAMTIVSNTPASPNRITLAGSVVAPMVSLAPQSLAFANQNVGTESSPQSVTISNTGDFGLTVASVAASPDFAQTNTCGATVPAGESCKISVTFKPARSGTRTGTVTLTSNAFESPHAVNLAGTGLALVPTVASISPAHMQVGAVATPTFPLTISGTGFLPNSIVRWNGSDRATTYLGETQLKANIAASDVADAGVFQVTVFNPAPGGGESNTSAFTVANPVPTFTSIYPPSALVAVHDLMVSVEGTNFVRSSVIRWNGVDRTTLFDSPTSLRTILSAGEMATAGAYEVNVFNPSPGGGVSATRVFNVYVPNPAPVVVSLSPAKARAGDPGFTLTVNGQNFMPTSVVQWDYKDRPTRYISEYRLEASISADDLRYGGVFQVGVQNPAPGGGQSIETFTVEGNPRPNLGVVSPSSVLGGGPAFTLTVSGTNFMQGSIVRWNGQDRPTTFVSDFQLTAAIPATDIAEVGSAFVTVFTPPPGGGLSTAATVTIGSNSAPSITLMTPTFLPMKSPPQELRLRGTGFNKSSVVRVNGQNRATTSVDEYTLTIALAADDLAKPGLAEIRVFNPPIGGGLSEPYHFLVTLGIPVSAIVYDKTRDRLIAAAPSSAGNTFGNRVFTIDPRTGELGTPVFVGSEPGKLALSDDGKSLYVALSGSPQIRRVDLTTNAVDLQFDIPPAGDGSTVYAEDMAVVPGNSHAVVVTRQNRGSSSRAAGIAVYDDGVKRPREISADAAGNHVEFAGSASTLYSLSTEASYIRSGLRALSLNSDGLTEVASFQRSWNGGDFRYDNGRLYVTSGDVIDARSGSQLGFYSLAALWPSGSPSTTGSRASGIAPDAKTGRTFLNAMGSGSMLLAAFDEKTFTPIGSIPAVFEQWMPRDDVLLRWGDDGLAYRIAAQGQLASDLVLFRSVAVRPPSFAADGVVNSAGFGTGAIAPGSWATIFGAGMATAESSANGAPFPTTLGGVRATLDGVAVPLMYVGPGQVNFQVPWEMSGKESVDLVVGAPGFAEKPVRIRLAAYGPGIFMLGAKQGAITIANTRTITAPSGTFPDSRPAERGQTVSIYCTGLGPVSKPPASGSPASLEVLAPTAETPGVTIGGVAAKVGFSGLTPGTVGLYQLNVEVPLTAPVGDEVPVTVVAGGVRSNTATMAIR